MPRCVATDGPTCGGPGDGFHRARHSCQLSRRHDPGRTKGGRNRRPRASARLTTEFVAAFHTIPAQATLMLQPTAAVLASVSQRALRGYGYPATSTRLARTHRTRHDTDGRTRPLPVESRERLRATSPNATAYHTSHDSGGRAPHHLGVPLASLSLQLWAGRRYHVHGPHSITASIGCRVRALPRAWHPGQFLLLAVLAAAALAAATAALAAGGGGPYGAYHCACDGGGRARRRSAPF